MIDRTPAEWGPRDAFDSLAPVAKRAEERRSKIALVRRLVVVRVLPELVQRKRTRGFEVRRTFVTPDEN